MDGDPDVTSTPPAAAPTGGPTGPAPNDRLATFPGRLVRPVPSFVFTIPRGWVVDEAPHALAVVRTPEEVDGYWVNAVLTHDRVARAVDLKVAAASTWEKVAAEHPQATVAVERLARFGPNIVYLRGVDYPATDTTRALSQLQALFFAPVDGAGKTVDFFELVCSAPDELMERFSSPFLEVIGSFRFT